MGRGGGFWRKWGVTERALCPEILVLLSGMGLALGAWTHAGSKGRVGARL